MAALVVFLVGSILCSLAWSAPSLIAFQRSFWWSVGLAAVSVLLAFVLPGRPRPAAPAATERALEPVGA